MKKSNSPIMFIIAVLIGMIIGKVSNKNTNLSLDFSSKNKQKIKRLINYIENDYVDKVNTDELLDNAINEILSKLDPHSVYIPKEELQAITENMQGNFVGVGIQFRVINDTITVIHPMKGGPSIKAGIKAGDRILMANQDTLFLKNLNSSDIYKTLKGKPNSKVKLQVYRKTNDSIFNVTIKRASINIKSVDVSYMLNDSIGYIKLDRFAQNSYIEFNVALNKLLKQNMTDLVLDLRGNSGGFIHIANEIVDEFLEDGKLIVFTKNNKENIEEYFATEIGQFEHGGLYILIDENSASASEIVAGALQDNDKGTIIGRRSFGKGLVQEEKDLGDGSAIRLTTARYYTPTGRSIQKAYKKTNNQSFHGYEKEINNRFYNGELFSIDSIKKIDSLQFKTPKGKIVYGGGGIIPDVFVPVDSSNYISPIFFKPLNLFSFNYVDKNRTKLNKLSIKEFNNSFDNQNKIINEFLKQFKQKKVSNKVKNQLKKYLKMLIARELYDDEGWYKINQKNDLMLKKVLELEARK